MRSFLLVLVVALSACTSLNHIESQRRLQEGYAAKVRSEQLALGMARTTDTDALLKLVEANGPEAMSTDAARLALARDARSDLEAVTGALASAAPEDRISALFRAELKAWHAGRAADPELVIGIADAGARACAAMKERKPVRDCEVLGLARELSLAQTAADTIFDLQVARFASDEHKLPASDLAELVYSVDDIEAAATGISEATLTGPVRKFADAQVIIYWCHAVAGLGQMLHVEDKDLGRDARKLLDADPATAPAASAALEAALTRSGVFDKRFIGANAALERQVARLDPNLVGGDLDANTRTCKRIAKLNAPEG